MRRCVLAVAATAALLASAARAGGIPVQVAAVGSTLWTVSDSGLLAVDPATGRILARPATPYAYPIWIAAGGGALWVASVANGFGSGAVTRVDGRTGRASTRLRLPHQGVYDVCAGGGASWAIVGRTRGRRVARLDSPAGMTQFVSLGSEPAWCAADARGAWVTTEDGRLALVDRRTNGVTEVARIGGLGVLTSGFGAVWATCADSLARIDERTRAIATIPLGGSPSAVATGRSGVWALVEDRRWRTRLIRIDPRTNRVVVRRRLAGSPTTILETRDALWIGGLDRRRYPVLLRLDPRSLVARQVVTLL